MTSYYICLVILVCGFGAILPASCCNITGEKILKAFDQNNVKNGLHGVIDFLKSTDQYINAANDIDKKWPTNKGNSEPEEIERLRKLSVGLMKCHTFAVHLQCSATENAPKFLMVMRQLMEKFVSNNKPDLIEQRIIVVREFAEHLTTYLLHLMTIFYNMGYAPPSWTVLLLIYCEDIQTKTELNMLLNDIQEYLLQTNVDIMAKVSSLLTMCSAVSPTLYKSSDSELAADEHRKILEYLKKTKDNFVSRNQEYLSFDLNTIEKFRPKNWLLISPIEAPTKGNINFKDLLTRPEWKYLGIHWKDNRNSMSENSIRKYKEFQDKNRNWMMQVFNGAYLTKYSSQNQIKEAYLAVISRFVLIGVSECDSLRNQIEQYETEKDEEQKGNETKEPGKNEGMRNTFKDHCSKIEEYVQLAIEYLGGNEFLNNLKVELSLFSNQFGKNGSNILLMVMNKLNSISGFLKVNAAFSYDTSATKLILYNRINTVVFQKSLRLDHAKQYTIDLKRHVPLLDFKIGKVMEMAATNVWIPALF